MAERPSFLKINLGSTIRALTFSANGEYLVSSSRNDIQVWRLEDGKEMAKMRASNARSLTMSKDGRWIAAGAQEGLFVWGSGTYEQLLLHSDDHSVTGVDFSPDSTRLVVASENGTTIVRDVASCQATLGPLDHEDAVRAVKYSPQGYRIATATYEFTRVYDSDDGHLLAQIPVSLTVLFHPSLTWFNNHLFVISDREIKEIDASTGLSISTRQVTDCNHFSCIVLSKRGEFLAYSANSTIKFWNTSTHSQLGLIEHAEDIRSIALSSDDRFIAIGMANKVVVKHQSRITEPDIRIGDVILDLWKHGQFVKVAASLTELILVDQNPSHHILACRALIRSRLQQWDAALDDAKQSIGIRPSVIGYVAMCFALVGQGKKTEAYRTCDIAFQHFSSSHTTFLLLIKAIIVCVAGDHDDAISRVEDLITTVHLNSVCYAVQAYMYFLLGNSHVDNGNYKSALQSFERAQARMQLHPSRLLSMVPLISGWKFDEFEIAVQQRRCEALLAAGHKNDACESLLDIMSTLKDEVYSGGSNAEWVFNFAHQCLSTPQDCSPAAQYDAASTIHVAPAPTTCTVLLEEWVKFKLRGSAWADLLISAVGFTAPRLIVYQVICDCLEVNDQLRDAVECFNQMKSELTAETTTHDERMVWDADFRRRCADKLERLGDMAMDDRRHHDAIGHYSTALSLNPVTPQDILVKRSKAYATRGLWKESINDADEVIKLDPSSPLGYERKHAALRGAGHYAEAIDTFDVMLSKMSESFDPQLHERSRQYVNPEKTKSVIRRAIHNTVRESPRVLINTYSGRLCNKVEQAASFESLPIFTELISSMTKHIDQTLIERELSEYYRYAMFSHKWEENEPSFERVLHTGVYELEEFPTHNKLQMFCKVARDAGFRWAWSDTCCIHKADHFVLQEALVSMFKWYRDSSLTIIFLLGVRSPSRRGNLGRSIWNTRAWTFQEYHASKVVRFYSEDWTLYMDLDIPNHKESPEIISEIEDATSISAPALMALQPGLDDIREKLRLASRRETTLVEDAAYSLLGIFSISMPIVYGEGDKALGRLLVQLLMSSGDTSILAWTGKSGSFNSCLPANIIVFNQLPTTHVPPIIEDNEMESMIARLRTTSSVLITSIQKLYDRLHELPVPSFSGRRMKLPCIAFTLGRVSATRVKSDSERIFQVKTTSLGPGMVEIRTTEDLSRLESLTLVHPWIDFLLDRRPVGDVDLENSFAVQLEPVHDSASATTWLPVRLKQPLGGWWFSAAQDATMLPSTDMQVQALELLVRLRRPFGALPLTPTRRNVAEYRRVAADTIITVQIQEDTPLSELVANVRMLDVL